MLYLLFLKFNKFINLLKTFHKSSIYVCIKFNFTMTFLIKKNTYKKNSKAINLHIRNYKTKILLISILMIKNLKTNGLF